jgi:hypothetical protein
LITVRFIQHSQQVKLLALTMRQHNLMSPNRRERPHLVSFQKR